MAARSRSLPQAASLVGLWVVLGFGTVVAGWDLTNHFGRTSVEELVFGAGPGPESPAPGPEWTAVLIFTPVECPGLMAVVDRLNQLNNRRLKVRGMLMVDPGRFPGWKDLLSANQIDFPVQQVDPARGNDVLEEIGNIRTPVVALLDRKHELRLTSNLADQAELVTLIQNAVERDSRK
jgi:hypothetical protein